MWETQPTPVTRRRLLPALLATLATLVLAGFAQAQKAPAEAIQAPPSRALTGAAAAGLPPDVARLHEVAALLERAVRDRDAEAVRQATDGETFFRAVIAGVDLPLRARAELRQGFGAFYTQLLTQRLPEEIVGGGSYEFVGLIDRPGPDGRPQRRLLFRIVGPGGLNYHEHVLGDPADGRPARVVDTFVLYGGESLRGILHDLVVNNDQALRNDGRLSPEVQTLDRMRECTAVGDVEGAVRTFDEAPEAARRSKGVRLARLHAASMLTQLTGDPAPLLAAVEDVRQSLGDRTPEAAVTSLDSLILAGRWNEAEAAVARLDAHTHGDPFLFSTRAVILQGRGRLDDARFACDALAKALPHLPNGYEMRAGVALEQKDYDRLLADLRTLRDRFHYAYGDFREDPAFRGFVASPQFRQWQADRPQDFVAD